MHEPSTNQKHPTSGDDESLQDWRQGDFAVDVGGFLFAGVAECGDAFEAEEHVDGIVGLVVISQTCDIVRKTGGRHFIAVCPLIKVHAGELSAIKKGRRPYLTDVENTDEMVFADLRRIMSIDKAVVCRWERQSGFKAEVSRVRFAAALERKFGQFAFPDEFDRALKTFRERVWSRHNKIQSKPGMVYRSLAQIRFRSDPDWSTEKRTISVVAIMHEKQEREVERNDINDELEGALGKIEWPDGYEWGTPKFLLGTAKDFTAQDVITSHRGDFDFLCY